MKSTTRQQHLLEREIKVYPYVEIFDWEPLFRRSTMAATSAN